jgi:putative CocE/NonD family hydrolase
MDKPSLIEPGRVYAYDIDLWNTCQIYKKGHRIRLEISSSVFPKYDRNLNTDGQLGKSADMKVAEQKISHDREHATYVLLPIVPRKVE